MHIIRRDPRNFHELVELIKSMEWNEWVENDDTGKLRVVVIGSMCSGRYELYEDHEFLGCTPDVVSAASFVAEGWHGYKAESPEEAARRRNREDFEESIGNGWIYG